MFNDAVCFFLRFRINTLLQDHNEDKTDTDSFIFPWPSILELFITKQLNTMYGESGKEKYSTIVHYCFDVWSKVIVENPLKEHASKFNSTLRSLNER